MRLGGITVPTLVVMGENVPDFPDPRAEAEWVADTARRETVLVPNAGHYPQPQRPDITADAVLRFLQTLDDR
jgi:pimeloyl-ACP methyl ester carboxylesterase